ncbi:hypothetical protein F5Y00DRAFT_261772 [Daldinia vernicosa]|uniref:uncharacterized protein n=1 Tax=Daldinia vernicosa TaxID=114800 RepID=UPI0020074E47|nr:uncharacterized protein F5Y00DRAFT_261772 [Daldinia vernicosa]KAI0849303.1 hypothetical protein F5Y00DRAFT_261772 [Daldinia vernicosa]
MSAINTINALHAEASRIIYQLGRAPTRAERGYALELADKAMELAIEAGFDGPSIETCEAVQRLCYDALLHSYSWTDNHERRMYEKSSSRTPVKSKRSARIYNVDNGEHVVEALEAVHIGNMLSNRVSVEPDAWNRRIRWVDEVMDQPIRTLVH